MNKSILLSLALLSQLQYRAFAFEDAQVLPKGVSRLSIRWVGSEVSNQTNEDGQSVSMGSALERDLLFRDVLNAESDILKRELAAGFLLANGWDESESLGSFRANVSGRIQVLAPIYSVGLTDRFTVAIGLPILSAATNVSMGYEASPAAQAFRDSLRSPANNQMEGAQEFVDEIAGATAALDRKLVSHGYAPLQPWQDSGLGDLQMVVKASLIQESYLRAAVQAGLVAPTGREDDPNQLLDVGFGDGQWDASLQIALDKPLGNSSFVLGQYAFFTMQLPGERRVRLKTPDEQIDVPIEQVRNDLGDVWGLGSSVRYAGEQGFVGGVGYAFSEKQKDRYEVRPESKAELESGSFRRSHLGQIEMGYSGIPAFKRGELLMPFEVNLSYVHQLASQNEPIAHRVQIETGVFF